MVLCVSTFHPALAQVESDAQSIALDSAVVRAWRHSSKVKLNADGSTVWDMRLMNELPQILGNADIMHYAQAMPGIQTNSEYRSGINIQGCEASHNYISIYGVPLYNVNHLLGFFSAFNPSHFSTTEISKAPATAARAGRIGGTLNLTPNFEITDSINGELTVGLISSQGTLRAPIGKKAVLAVSLRAAYMNLLYGKWLDTGDGQIKYSFFDSNASLKYDINNRHSLVLDYYGGGDKGSFLMPRYGADMAAQWGNYAGAAHWLFKKENLDLRNTFYTTHYRNRFKLKMAELNATLPSDIHETGYKGLLHYKKWTAGANAAYYLLHPQSITTEGYTNISPKTPARQKAFETTLFCDYRQPLAKNLAATVGLKGTLWHTGSTTFAQADPSASLTFDNSKVQASLAYAFNHQNLFQAGFTDMGLPTEFWFAAGKEHRPQRAHTLCLSTAAYFAKRRYRLSADLFLRRLFNQIEYKGNVLDLVNTVYDYSKALIHGQGTNYGASIMLQKCSGKLTGWCAYTYSRARRTFVELDNETTFPANHDRPHEGNILVSYSPNKHWNASATFVFASGNPFTAPEALCLINNNIVCIYGPHNANRLNPYYRLDLSASYKWRGKLMKEQGFNVSLYNATGHANELFWTIDKRADGAFAYRPVSFIIKALPSLSYFCKF